MTEQLTRYGLRSIVDLPYDQAVAQVRQSLAEEGFGVLTEIDVASTLKTKLGVEFPPYVILGACNPPLAHRALTAEQDIGLLLPCNVIVYPAGEPGHSVVAALDPIPVLELSGNEAVRHLAEEVRGKMERVLARLPGG